MTKSKASAAVFEHVDFGYEKKLGPVIVDLSLAIKTGSVTALLGANGAGKSTLLQLALGKQRPWAGRVLFEGRELSSWPRRALGRGMAMVAQSERISFEYSVLEYVLLGRAPHLATLELPGPVDIDLAMAAIEQVGIAELAYRSITSLSGGELQLATIARALAQQPRFLMLDEPASHLDLANKLKLLRLISRLAATGMTLLFSTHEPDMVEAVADQVILMREGRVIGSGGLDEMLSEGALSGTYGIPIRVAKVEGRRVVLWTQARSDGEKKTRLKS